MAQDQELVRSVGSFDPLYAVQASSSAADRLVYKVTISGEFSVRSYR